MILGMDGTPGSLYFVQVTPLAFHCRCIGSNKYVIWFELERFSPSRGHFQACVDPDDAIIK